jgi:hypothetical protein
VARHPEDDRFVAASELAYGLPTSTIERCGSERMSIWEISFVVVVMDRRRNLRNHELNQENKG